MYDVYNPEADNARRIVKKRRRAAKEKIKETIRETMQRRREANEEAEQRRVVNEAKIKKAQAKEQRRQHRQKEVLDGGMTAVQKEILAQLSSLAAELAALHEDAKTLNRRVVEHEEAMRQLQRDEDEGVAEGVAEHADSSYESDSG